MNMTQRWKKITENTRKPFLANTKATLTFYFSSRNKVYIVITKFNYLTSLGLIKCNTVALRLDFLKKEYLFNQQDENTLASQHNFIFIFKSSAYPEAMSRVGQRLGFRPGCTNRQRTSRSHSQRDGVHGVRVSELASKRAWSDGRWHLRSWLRFKVQLIPPSLEKAAVKVAAHRPLTGWGLAETQHPSPSSIPCPTHNFVNTQLQRKIHSWSRSILHLTFTTDVDTRSSPEG